MVIQGEFKVLGEFAVTLAFLASGNKEIAKMLEAAPEADKLLAWYQTRLKPDADRLISHITKFKEMALKGTEWKDVSKEFKEILKFHLPALEDMLAKSKHTYLCGSTVSPIDILFYFVISTVLTLIEQTQTFSEQNSAAQRDFKHLTKWYNSVPKTCQHI